MFRHFDCPPLYRNTGQLFMHSSSANELANNKTIRVPTRSCAGGGKGHLFLTASNLLCPSMRSAGHIPHYTESGVPKHTSDTAITPQQTGLRTSSSRHHVSRWQFCLQQL